MIRTEGRRGRVGRSKGKEKEKDKKGGKRKEGNDMEKIDISEATMRH